MSSKKPSRMRPRRKECVSCGEGFNVVTNNQKCCSPECRKAITTVKAVQLDVTAAQRALDHWQRHKRRMSVKVKAREVAARGAA